MTTLTLELTEDQSWALAELYKRISYTDFRNLSKNDDEANAMRDGVYELAKALKEQGFNPR